MTKIPVLETIRAAYRFVFTHLGAIIGLIWLPMILFTVTGFFVLQRFLLRLADALASNNFALVGPSLLGVISYALVSILLLAMMAVPVAELALGSRKGGALAHFAFGPPEWRLFRAGLGLVGLMFALLMLVSLGASAIFGAGAMTANLAALAVFYIGVAYFGLRFGFLLPAAAADEPGPLLLRAWQLSAGNFWRILLIFIAVALPLRLLMILAEVAIEGIGFLEPRMFTSTAMMAAQIHAEAMNMPATTGILFLVAPVALGLVVGAGAHAYRVLKGAPG